MQQSGKYRVVTAFLLAGLVLLPSAAAAQFDVGQKHIGVHVGVSGVGSTAAFGVNGEVAYTDRIGIGLWADTWSYGDDYTIAGSRYGWDVRYIALAGTGAYHFPVESNPKLDPFVGLALGYFIVNSEARGSFGVDYSGSASRIFLGGFGGARYALSDAISGVARIGFGAAYLTVGVDFKL